MSFCKKGISSADSFKMDLDSKSFLQFPVSGMLFTGICILDLEKQNEKFE